MLTYEILSARHTENIKKLLVSMVCFHLSLSGCSTRSLETCTHVIPMPKPHTHPTTTMNFKFEPELLPTPQLGDENVEISGLHNPFWLTNGLIVEE